VKGEDSGFQFSVKELGKCMPVWTKSLMTTAFFDDTEAYEDEECIIRIDEKFIEVSYDDEEENVIYRE
jgi:hypothetical protein